jgi:very-long-chain (3R)-3-hydroxyacyl-CoA dehydratase
MVFSWSITEVIRYLFYALKENNISPYLLLWARYSTFLILYPSGVAGEMGMLYFALEAFKRGTWGTYFNFYPVAVGILILYLPGIYHYSPPFDDFVGLPFMYLHMAGQRRKQLGGKTKPKTKKIE